MLKVGVIGAGWVTAARHIPALRRSGRCEILGIVDRHLDRAQNVARRLKLPHAADSLDAPWLKAAQAVSIGTSPMSHFEVAGRMLDEGKHVLLEKPMCLTVAEGEALVERARDKNLVLAIVHNFQFARSVMQAKARLREGRWGKVIGLHGFQLSSEQRRLPDWYEQLPLGLFYDESPHLLYLFKAFGGDVQLRHAHIVRSARPRATPAVVQANFQAGDVTATLFMNFEASVSEWHLLVLTEGGLAVIDVFRDILHFVPCDGEHLARDVTRSSLALLGSHAWGFFTSGVRMVTGRLLYGNEEVVRRFIDAVEGKAPLRDIDAQSALDILKLQHAILDRAP